MPKTSVCNRDKLLADCLRRCAFHGTGPWPHRPRLDSPPGGVRVLVVEDHWHVANALKLWLETGRARRSYAACEYHATRERTALRATPLSWLAATSCRTCSRSRPRWRPTTLTHAPGRSRSRGFSFALRLEGLLIYLAQSCQRLRGRHPRGQRLRGQRQSLGIRSHANLGSRNRANPGSRSRANPNVGRSTAPP